GFSVERAEAVTNQSEGKATGENPLQTPSPEQSGEREHGDNFADLTKRHPRRRVFESEVAQVWRCVWVERRQRDCKQGRCDKYHTVVGVLQQRQRIPAEALSQG